MGLNKQKTDPALGLRIHTELMRCGVETPIVMNPVVPLDDMQKIDQVKRLFTTIMEILGMNLKDDSLHESPHRVAKMFVTELFWGLNPDNFPKMTTIENKMQYDEMVLEKNIGVMSCCEHHFVTISGVAHVAYIPDRWVLGLSKLNRVVEYFSRRPQVQERLTEQVFHALAFILETQDVAVVVEAEHFCVKARGVEDPHSRTITSKLGGKFKSEPELRGEFMNLIRG